MTKKIIYNRIDADLQFGIPRHGAIHQHLQPWRRGQTRRDAAPQGAGIVGKPQGGAKLRLQQAQHADAVLQLGIFFIKLIRWELTSRLQIELVSAEKNARAEFLYTAVTEGGDLVDGIRRVLRRERTQRVEPLTVARESDRHDGHTVNRGIERGKLPHAVIQFFPVVEARAADDLTVHHDACFRQPLHGADTLTGAGIAQHADTQLRIHRMDRYVHRAHMKGDDPIDLPRGEVGQSDVVSQQEAQAGIVVLEVHRRAHALRKLVDEAEDTVVRTGTRPVHQIALKIQTQVAALRLVNMQAVFRAVRPGEQQMQIPVIGIEFVVQDVEDAFSVDAEKTVTDGGPLFQRAAGIDAADHILHSVHQNECQGSPRRRRGEITINGRNNKGGKAKPSSSKILLALFYVDDRTAVILSASRASAVRHNQFAAVGACYQLGSGELPNGRAPLITSLSRDFSFWDCHVVDTS